MRIAAIQLAAALCLAFSGAAQSQGALRELATSDDVKGWEAVGRIDIAGSGYCTGTLIAPDLVLTAAHCLYHPHTGHPVQVEEFEFRAGWRNGRAEAYRSVRRTVSHPGYVYEGRDKVDRVAFDVALLELDRPIRHPSIRPFRTAGRPRQGDAVGVISYATGRDEAPSFEELCEVIASQSNVLMLSCEVDYGASGSPIFIVENGEARIVSIVSAKAEIAARRVALAAELGSTLEVVRGLLNGSDGVFHRLDQPEGANTPPSGGAKFVQP